MSENLPKGNKKKIIKKIRKICFSIIMLILVSGAIILYILPMLEDLKENLPSNTQNEYFEEENNQLLNNNNNNEIELNEKVINQPNIKDEIPIRNCNLITSKLDQMENNCKKYALFVNNLLVLQEKIMNGRGFDKEVNELKNLKIIEPSIKNILEELSIFSEVGVPNFFNLRDQFYSMSDDIIKIYQLENESNKIRKRMLKFFQELIFIKKVGERAIKKGGIEGIVQNIKNLLENEQIPEAILEVKKITNIKVKDMVDSWSSDCKKYLELQELYENFKKQILEKMTCSSFSND